MSTPADSAPSLDSAADGAGNDPAQGPASRFADLHNRTFEMELLISGVVVFALLQVPPHIHRALDLLTATLHGALRSLVIYGYVYGLLMLTALIAFFVLHLGLRAYWIGLVGLESVFPDGINWNQISLGPYSRNNLKRSLRPLPAHIERLDDLCSLVFSFAFLIAHSGLYSLVIVLLAGALGLASSWVLSPSIDPVWLFVAAMLAAVGPLLVVTWVDKLAGDRIDPNSTAGRWLHRLVRWTYRTSPLPMVGHIQLTLQSRFSERRTTLAIFFTILLLTFGLVGQSLVRTDALRFDTLERFPDDLDAFGAEPVDYRDQHAPVQVVARNPSIQSDVIEGPFVKLFIPYYPHRHHPLLEQACPGTLAAEPSPLRFRPSRAGGADRRELVLANLDCLASLFRVELDGQRLGELEWVPTREAGSHVAGLMAYLPTRGLAAGRHQIVVEEPAVEANLEPHQTEEPHRFAPTPEDRVATLYFWYAPRTSD